MPRPLALWIAFLLYWAGTLLWNGAVSAAALPWAAMGMSAIYAASLVLLKEEPLRIGRGPWLWIHAWLAILLIHLLPAWPLLFPETAAWRAAHGVGPWPAAADAPFGARTVAAIQSYLLAALLVMRLRAAGLSTTAVIGGLLTVAGAEAAYGVAQALGGFAEIPFHGPRAAPDSASGTLVGRNNFAGFMAVGLVLSAARAFSRWAWPPRKGGDDGRPSPGRRLEVALGWALLAGLFAAAIVLSKSRGGALAALAGVLLLPFFHRGRAAGAALAVLLVLLGLGVFVADPTGLAARFATIDPFEPSTDSRWQIAAATVKAALRQPLLGFGWGAHATAFHPYQPPTLPGQIQHAHNEYVNVLFEAGFPGLILMLAGLVLWFRRVWAAQRPLPSPDRLPVAAAMAAVAALAIHSLVDFDLRITSIGLLAGVLLGLGAAAVRGGDPRPAWPPLLVAPAVAALVWIPLPAGPKERLRWMPYDHAAAWELARTSGEPRRHEIAADLFPAHPDLQREAGLLFWNNGMLEPSAKCFRRLFEQDPRALGALAPQLLEDDPPLSDVEKLLPDRPMPKALLAGELARRGRWKEGLELFNRCVPGVPANATAHDAFADRLGEAGQWGLEAGVRDRRLQAASDAGAYAASAVAWQRLKVWDRALDRASMACRIDPGQARWEGLRGEILGAKGDRMGAIEAFTAARSKEPSNLEWTLRRGLQALADRQHQAAAGDLGEVLRSRPEDRAARLGLARAETALGRREAARMLLDEWLRKRPDDVEARTLREALVR